MNVRDQIKKQSYNRVNNSLQGHDTLHLVLGNFVSRYGDQP